MRNEFLDFAFQVSLNQPTIKNAIEQKHQLVAYWFYHSDCGEFDYSYDIKELKTHEALHDLERERFYFSEANNMP